MSGNGPSRFEELFPFVLWSSNFLCLEIVKENLSISRIRNLVKILTEPCKCTRKEKILLYIFSIDQILSRRRQQQQKKKMIKKWENGGIIKLLTGLHLNWFPSTVLVFGRQSYIVECVRF